MHGGFRFLGSLRASSRGRGGAGRGEGALARRLVPLPKVIYAKLAPQLKHV